MRLSVVAGARPNFMKGAPLLRALEGRAEVKFVHTGQHYDWKMSNTFLADLEMREPDFNLDVGSGTHAGRTADRIARILLAESPGSGPAVDPVSSSRRS